MNENLDESFFSSPKSQLAKVRRGIWLGALLGLVLAFVATKGAMDSLIFTVVIMLLIFGAFDWIIRRQLKPGQALIILSRDAIESSILTGKIKRYPWSDIVSVSVEANQNAQFLKVQIAESPDRPNKRSFWNGTNPTQLRLPMSSFEPEVQERIFAAINCRLQQSRADAGETYQAPVNPLIEEREFQEKLKALAPIPWITYLIIAINILVWGLNVSNGAGVLQAPADKLLLWGGNAASEVQKGEWWRLLTATFLHSGLMHLTMNMIGLFSVGITVERIYGHRLFALIYLGSGLIGSALSLNFSAQQVVSVGASGAVFGIAGALVIGVFQHKEQLPKAFGKQTISGIGIFILYSLMQGFTKLGIDNAAHIGGLLGGCLLAYLLPERFDMERFITNMKRRAIAGIAIVLVATTGLAAIAPHATIDQKRNFEGQAAFLSGMKAFETAFKSIQQEAQDVKAGKITGRESDDRSRTVHAPMFRNVLQELSKATLYPSDPRLPLLNDAKRLTELMLESLEMQSVYKNGSDKPEPADPVRMVAITEELNTVSAHFAQLAKDTKAKQQN